MNPDNPDRPISYHPLAGTPHTRVGGNPVNGINSKRMSTPALEPMTLTRVLEEFGMEPILIGAAGSYQIQGYISHSSKGAVFYGRELRSNREVVLKKVNDEYREQFKQEKYIQDLLKKRGVNLKSKGGNRHLLLADEFLNEPAVVVTRYLRFGDLREFIKTLYKTEVEEGDQPRDITPTPYQAKNLICGACKGLQYIHDCNVVLRDVKSRNMVLDAKPSLKKITFENLQQVTLKYLDFETGYDRTNDQGYVEGIFVGTPYYNSPETIEGKKHTPQSDIYSLGAVIYEILTGRRPFEEEGETDEIEVLEKQLKGAVPKMAQFNPSVGKDLQYLVEKTMDKDPRNRHQTADELWRHYAMLLR